MLALLLALTLGQTAKPAPKPAPAPKPVLTPVEGHMPRVGDVLTVYARTNGTLGAVSVAKDVEAFRAMAAFSMAKDYIGLEELASRKAVFKLESGVNLRILEIGQGGRIERVVGRRLNRADGSGGQTDIVEVDQEPPYRWFAARIESADSPLVGTIVYVDKKLVKKCELVYPKAKRKKK